MVSCCGAEEAMALALVLRRWEEGWIRTRCGCDGRRNETKGFRCGWCAETVAVIATCIDLALFVFCLFFLLRLWWQWGGGREMDKNREEVEFSGLGWAGHDKATLWALWAYWVVYQRRNVDC
jgi:hypothetical protein